jgi:hypothetical protein
MIQGLNPSPSVAKAYIIANDNGFDYSWAIAQWESSQGSYIFNQFNTANAPGADGLLLNPQFGSPSGWGMFQRDPAHDPNPILTSEVWNWQTNVLSGIAELGRKRGLAQQYFSAVQRTQNFYKRPYVSPPSTWCLPWSELNGKSAATLDVSEIQLYNGSGYNPALIDPLNDLNKNQPNYPQKDTYNGTFELITTTGKPFWQYIPCFRGHKNYDYVEKVFNVYYDLIQGQ